MDCPRFDPWTTDLYRTTVRIGKHKLKEALTKNSLEFFCHTGQLMRAPIAQILTDTRQIHLLHDTVELIIYLDRDQVWTIFVNPSDQVAFDY